MSLESADCTSFDCSALVEDVVELEVWSSVALSLENVTLRFVRTPQLSNCSSLSLEKTKRLFERTNMSRGFFFWL